MPSRTVRGRFSGSGASTTASYHFASVSPMPASRYSAGALRTICGSTSTRKFASSKISNCSAWPSSLYQTESGVHAAQVAAMVGMPTNGTPERRATALTVSITAPPPMPITTLTSLPASFTRWLTSRSLQWPLNSRCFAPGASKLAGRKGRAASMARSP